MNYSVDTLKKAAFVDEINNVLKVLKIEAPDQFDEGLCAILEYLQKRLKEIESNYKN
jgi:hypothetical protein